MDFQYVAKTVKGVGFTCLLQSAIAYTMDLKWFKNKHKHDACISIIIHIADLFYFNSYF